MELTKNGVYCVVPLLFVLWVLLNFDNGVLSQTRVTTLPGFNGTLPFYLETGYIGVEGDELQLFYYFVESENNPKEDPLIYWLTGGPHCSGMSAILYEIGPFQIEEMTYTGKLPKLLLRQYSWTKTANILFVDMPVGTGYSYATTARANYSGDLKASDNVNEFLKKWLLNHTEYISNPLYVGGDSYTGFTLPIYFDRMVNDNEDQVHPILNLKGYLLGNPATDSSIDGNTQVPLAHGMGLISDEFFESFERICKGDYHTIDPDNYMCMLHFARFEEDLHGIQTTHILENYCNDYNLQLHESSTKKRIMLENTNKFYHAKENGAFSCRKEGYKLSQYWMNDKSVREALHVFKESPTKWIRCNFGFNYSYEMVSSVKYHAKLSAKGFRSLIYSGDHDMIVPFIGTQTWIRSLNYSIHDEWRKWTVDDQIAGFTRTYSNNMTFATIKGAGHTAPEYKPKQCAAMFKRWIVGELL
ncbi:hypothetical protein RND81_01G101100 [Saponaria officinalis]|uniref:Uncharacterized protein n=1 Tax=Saponaria officinalis TaxID=3572 RepID=A0AAW1NE31_SAPOF